MLGLIEEHQGMKYATPASVTAAGLLMACRAAPDGHSTLQHMV
jgi:hypothetical protein